MGSMKCNKVLMWTANSDGYFKNIEYYNLEKVFNKAVSLDVLQGKFTHLDLIGSVWETQNGVTAIS